MKYFITYNICTHIIIRIINININFIYKINFKNKIFIYTKCPIKLSVLLNNALRFLKNYDRYGKMFQTKVVWFEEGHKKIPLIWPWVAPLRSDQGHINFI